MILKLMTMIIAAVATLFVTVTVFGQTNSSSYMSVVPTDTVTPMSSSSSSSSVSSVNNAGASSSSSSLPSGAPRTGFGQ